jgi:nicotinamide riboside transporter PnuC
VWARDMRVNGSAISCFDLAGMWLPFATRCFCIHGENCAGLFWQAIILALMVIAQIALVD